MTEAISNSLKVQLQKCHVKVTLRDHFLCGFSMDSSNPISDIKHLTVKTYLTLFSGSNPVVFAIYLEWVLQGLNRGGICNPQRRTPESATFPD